MKKSTKVFLIAIVAIYPTYFVAWVVYDAFSTTRFALTDQSNPNVVWSKSVGLRQVSIEDIATSGNHVYIAGTKSRVVTDFGPGEQGFFTKNDGYIAKLDARTGRLANFKRYEFIEDKTVIDISSAEIALDPKSNFLYLSMNPGGKINRTLQKDSPDGRTMWSKQTRSHKITVAMRVGLDGSLYIVDLIETHKIKTTKYKIQKMDSDGKPMWHQKINDFGDIDFDNDGNVYVTRSVEESEHTYPAITSYSKKGKPRWTRVIRDATEVSDIKIACDKQKDIVNVVIRKPEGQNSIWRKYSTSGKILNSRQLNIEVDAMAGGSQGKVYLFTNGFHEVTMRGYARSGKLLFKEEYDRSLFAVDDEHSWIIAVSAKPDDDGNDAIYTRAGGEPAFESSVSRLKLPAVK